MRGWRHRHILRVPGNNQPRHIVRACPTAYKLRAGHMPVFTESATGIMKHDVIDIGLLQHHAVRYKVH